MILIKSIPLCIPYGDMDSGCLKTWTFQYCSKCFKEIMHALQHNNKMSHNMNICNTFNHIGWSDDHVQKLEVLAFTTRRGVWKFTNTSRRAILTDIKKMYDKN